MVRATIKPTSFAAALKVEARLARGRLILQALGSGNRVILSESAEVTKLPANSLTQSSALTCFG